MTNYYFEMLLLPVFTLPVLFIFRLLSSRIFIILWTSFFLSVITESLLDNSMISICVLVFSITFQCVFFRLKGKVKKKNYSIALIVERTGGELLYFDGKEINKVPFLPKIPLEKGHVIKVSKPFDF